MNQIEKLIQQYCPEGVEWKTIGEVTKVYTGGEVPENSVKGHNPTEEYKFPIYANGAEVYGYTDNYRIDKDAVTISSIGANTGSIYFRSAFFTPTIRLKVLLPNDERLHTKFLFYFLSSITINSKKSSVPNLNANEVKKISIPVPPLPVQEAIVSILDKFTSLEAELEAELEARRAQYDYYRNQLLTPVKVGDKWMLNGVEVEWKTLDQISKNLDSKRKPVKSSAREKGQYPYYGASGVVDYVSDYIFEGDYLLISEDGANLVVRNTPIAFSISGKTWVNNHAHVLEFDSYATRRITEFYINLVDVSEFVLGGAQPKLNQKNLNKIKIPIPPLAEQERIVSILDKFDSLVNDISIGLPAEIEARRKQYEYYRERLLAFKEAEPQIEAG